MRQILITSKQFTINWRWKECKDKDIRWRFLCQMSGHSSLSDFCAEIGKWKNGKLETEN